MTDFLLDESVEGQTSVYDPLEDDEPIHTFPQDIVPGITLREILNQLGFDVGDK